MKKVIIGSVLFISGIIGIASSIISSATILATYGGIKPKLIVSIFEGLDNFNLAVPFIISLFLIIFGIVLVISGYRDKD